MKHITTLLALGTLTYSVCSPLALAQPKQTGPLGFGDSFFRKELASDRPDFTESAQTIEKGHLQLEAGYTYTKDSAGGVKTETHTVPEILLRGGLTPTTEFRLVWLGAIVEDIQNGSSEEGVSDFSLGFKHEMAAESKALPAFSYLFELALPTGSSDFSADDPEATLKFLSEKGLTDRVGIASNLNFTTLREGDSYVLETGASLSTAIDLTGGFGMYVEYFGTYPSESVESGPQHNLNGGFTYLAHENLQFDVRAGFGLNGRADDFFSGAGLVYRY